MSRAYLTVDLGYGDSGKGTIVDALVRQERADLVVRYNGGAQCAHNVITDDGIHHCFHQYGSATLQGVDTLLGPRVKVNPREALKEAALLDRHVHGHYKLYVDEEALITTPWHMALNRIRETARGQNRHGSCGMGIGETVMLAQKSASPLRIRDLDLSFPVLCDKLEHVRQSLKDEADKLSNGDASTTSEVFKVREFTPIAEEMKRFASTARILPHDDCLELIASHDTVFEGAQGVLLDEDWGFHPYTTWSHTTLQHAEELVKEVGCPVTQRLGIIRPYMTRHGAGPLMGELSELTSLMFAGQYWGKLAFEKHNVTNPWQSGWRVGMPDPVAWRYAAQHAGDLTALAVTHVDRLTADWPFIPDDHYSLAAFNCASPDDLKMRQSLTELLECLEHLPITPETIAPARVVSHLGQKLGLPVAITSSGPKTGDKTFFPVNA